MEGSSMKQIRITRRTHASLDSWRMRFRSFAHFRASERLRLALRGGRGLSVLGETRPVLDVWAELKREAGIEC